MKKLSRPSLTPQVLEITKPKKKKSLLRRLITATILASALTCNVTVPQISYAATATSQAQSMVNTNYSTAGIQQASYHLTVNGVDKTSELSFIAQNNRSMIGLRSFANILNCTVDWDTNKVAIVKKDNITLEVPIGSKQILVNGTPKNIDDQGTLSIILNSSTYLPFRVIAESLGYTVGYDASTKTIQVTSPSSGGQQRGEKPIENKYGVTVPAGMENTTWLEQYNYFRDEYGMTDAQAQQNMTQVHPAPLWTSDKRNKGDVGIMSDAQQRHYLSYDNAIRDAVDNGTASQMPTEAGSFKGEMRGEWRFDEAGWTVDMGAYTGLNGYSD